MKRSRIQSIVWISSILAAFFIVIIFSRASETFKKMYGRSNDGAQNQEVSHQEVLDSLSDCYNHEKRNTCFKEMANNFVARNELSTVFTVLGKNQQTPKVFESCHVLLHFMGQSAYKKFKNVHKAFKNGNHVCFAGFYHGTLEGYFIENKLLAAINDNVDALKKAVPKICVYGDQSGVKRDYYECLHGLGHGFMFATDGKLPQALKFCDSLPPSETGWCYSGVFMENSTSTTNPDHPSKYLNKDDPLYPCDVLDEKYLGTCYMLQSMYFAQLTNGNWPKNIDLCMRVPVNYRGACINGFGQNLVGYSADPEVVKKCLLVPMTYQNSCIEGAVGAMGEKYKDPFPIVSGLCVVFEGNNRGACYDAIFHRMANWTVDKKELEDFCTNINETTLKNTCISRL